MALNLLFDPQSSTSGTDSQPEDSTDVDLESLFYVFARAATVLAGPGSKTRTDKQYRQLRHGVAVWDIELYPGRTARDIYCIKSNQMRIDVLFDKEIIDGMSPYFAVLPVISCLWQLRKVVFGKRMDEPVTPEDVNRRWYRILRYSSSSTREECQQRLMDEIDQKPLRIQEDDQAFRQFISILKDALENDLSPEDKILQPRPEKPVGSVPPVQALKENAKRNASAVGSIDSKRRKTEGNANQATLQGDLPVNLNLQKVVTSRR